MKTNIWEYSELPSKISQLTDKRIVLAGGCFDLIHYGHFIFLQNAKKEGDILIIALESDEFIVKKKNRHPIHTQKQRAEILASLEMVDSVILLPLFTTDKEYSEMVSKIKPAVIAVTGGDTQTQNKKSQGEQVQAEVKVVSPLLPEFSTSQIMHYEKLFRS